MLGSVDTVGSELFYVVGVVMDETVGSCSGLITKTLPIRLFSSW